jgi:hypothetical protein
LLIMKINIIFVDCRIYQNRKDIFIGRYSVLLKYGTL